MRRVGRIALEGRPLVAPQLTKDYVGERADGEGQGES